MTSTAPTSPTTTPSPLHQRTGSCDQHGPHLPRVGSRRLPPSTLISARSPSPPFPLAHHAVPRRLPLPVTSMAPTSPALLSAASSRCPWYSQAREELSAGPGPDLGRTWGAAGREVGQRGKGAGGKGAGRQERDVEGCTEERLT